MKIIINIKNETKADQFIGFLKEIPFIEIESDIKTKTSKRSSKLPAEFNSPLKVHKYLKTRRDEIYEDRIR